MDQLEYLNTVADQIRYGKARSSVKEELENHIEDQKQAYLSEGMEIKKASQKAIEDMGDPVEVGIALDRIHRPQMEWKMIVLVLVISLLGILVQCVIEQDMGSEYYPYNLRGQIANVLLGIMVMMFFCFMDYTRIGMWGKAGASVMILLLVLCVISGETVNGQLGYLKLYKTISMHQIMYLYPSFFGGVLYSYKDLGSKGFFKSFIWILIPAFMILKLSNISLSVSLLVIMLIQVCFVIRKGWFGRTKKTIAAIASFIIAFPVVMVLYFLFFGEEYQKNRILTWLTWIDADTKNFQQQSIRSIVSSCNWIGQSTEGVVGSAVPSDFILTYILSYYGILAAVIVVAILGLFIFKLFKISIFQKNQLGYVIGTGCSLVFAVQIVMYVLVNITILPSTQVYLPLFSYGGTGTIISFALIGILLSIYRYQNVLPDKPFRKRKNKFSEPS